MSKGHGVVQRRVLELLELELGQMWQADLIKKLAAASNSDIKVVGASVRRAVGQLSKAGLIEIQYPPHARTSQLNLVGFKKKTTAQQLLSSESNEWYTPPDLIERVRVVLGGTIDLDPASNLKAQEWIRSTQFYTIHDDGFNRPWKGSVFLNPPYGQRNLKKTPPNLGASAWLEKLVGEYNIGNISQAVALCRGDSDGLKLLRSKATKCEPPRIHFYKPTGERSKSPVPGSVFYYLGSDDTLFRQVFGSVGTISRTV